ncbi:MAG: hypothetical protein NPMRTH4_2010002 [Nitrosopumilales archaeon]|nr:MAG: hypothetical protein NPMRTH4_2010002 [Nitrosopumilales archaeon]
MNKVVLVAGLLAIYVIGYYGMTAMVYAQYMGNVGGEGETGQRTLEETLELAKRRIEAVEANPGSGSGTPIMDANGVIGSAVIAGAIFGGISGVLLFKGRSGKYAAQGRG